jgi:hypothetical protein
MKILKIIAAAIFCLQISCKTTGEQGGSDAKFTTRVKVTNPARYEKFLDVLKACLNDTKQAKCIGNLNPGVILPLELADSGQKTKLDGAFDPKPVFLACDPSSTNACSLILKRTNSATSDLVIQTDTQKEDLSKLTFTGGTFAIKMRLQDDGKNEGKTIEICKIEGLKATSSGFTTAIVKVVFLFDSNGHLLPENMDGVRVTVASLGGRSTSNCNFPGDGPN